MKNARIDIGSIRREQIVEAAVSVITEQGLQNLSLSAIEEKAGMSRGQLTYYFPAKEDILLAVFDRLLQLIYERIGADRSVCAKEANPDWQLHLHQVLKTMLAKPLLSPEFHCLQYTFLSQITHREDYRQRLASLYEEWRGQMTRDMADDVDRSGRQVSPRAVASLILAMLHGLAIQNAADPGVMDPEEMAELFMEFLSTYLQNGRRSQTGRKPVNGKKKSTTDDVVHESPTYPHTKESRT